MRFDAFDCAIRDEERIQNSFTKPPMRHSWRPSRLPDINISRVWTKSKTTGKRLQNNRILLSRRQSPVDCRFRVCSTNSFSGTADIGRGDWLRGTVVSNATGGAFRMMILKKACDFSGWLHTMQVLSPPSAYQACPCPWVGTRISDWVFSNKFGI